MTPVLELRDVGKSFDAVEVLRGISFSVTAGSIAALLGPSGCGKTTLLRILAGLLEPSAGSVVIAGRDMRGVRPYERSIGLVFQDYALFPHLTVAQNVAYGLARRRWPKGAIPARVEAMLALVRLTEFAKRFPTTLSGGQQQRVALARALAIEPELLLLDEPLSALDAKLRQELRAELKEILRSVGSTTIIVTHDQDEAMSLADHIVVLADGRILQQGAPAEVYRRPSTREVAAFLGRSNWFRGRLGEPLDAERRAFIGEGLRLIVPAAGAPVAGECELCVRPERMRLCDPDEPSAAPNVLDGRIADVVVLGAEVHVALRLDSGQRILIVEQNRDQGLPEPGARRRVCFNPSDCIVLARGAAERNGRAPHGEPGSDAVG